MRHDRSLLDRGDEADSVLSRECRDGGSLGNSSCGGGGETQRNVVALALTSLVGDPVRVTPHTSPSFAGSGRGFVTSSERQRFCSRGRPDVTRKYVIRGYGPLSATCIRRNWCRPASNVRRQHLRHGVIGACRKRLGDPLAARRLLRMCRHRRTLFPAVGYSEVSAAASVLACVSARRGSAYALGKPGSRM